MKNWRIKAIEAGRICPECKQTVSINSWKEMTRYKDVRPCWLCKYSHWEIPLRGSGGSARYDNQDREAWDRIRGKG